MYQEIVVGTDGSAGAGIAVGAALGQAVAAGGTLHVVSAYRNTHGRAVAMAPEAAVLASAAEADKAAHDAAEQICADAVARADAAGVRAVGHVIADHPADALIDVAAEVGADLIVVGNRGMAGARRFVLGSVPNKVSHRSPTNLLIVDTAPDRTATARRS